MKKVTQFLILLSVFLMLIMPSISLAQGESGYKGLIPCSNAPASTNTVTPPGDCDFVALMNLINKIIRFALFNLAIPISAIMFAYAGFLLITAQGGEAKTQAKHIFTNTVLGLVLAAAAWLIVRTLLSILGYEGAWIGF